MAAASFGDAGPLDRSLHGALEAILYSVLRKD
jgi:hypothetical protein